MENIQHIPYLSNENTDWFQVPSQSNPETPHLVRLDFHAYISDEPGHFAHCDCKGFQIRKTCAHVTAAQAHFAAPAHDWDESAFDAAVDQAELATACPDCGGACEERQYGTGAGLKEVLWCEECGVISE